MPTSKHIESLIAELIENSKRIGRIDERTEISYTPEGPDTPTDLTRNAVAIHTRQIELTLELGDALHRLTTKKSILKRLFNR